MLKSNHQNRFKYSILLIFLLATLRGFAQGDFVAGSIITLERDTVECELLVHKNKRKERKSAYTLITIKDSTSQIRTLNAKQVLGYRKGNKVYKAFRPSSLKTYVEPNGFFALYLVKGKVNLLHTPYWPRQVLGKYLFKKQRERGYNVIDDSFEQRVADADASRSGAQLTDLGRMEMESPEQAFRKFFANYFRDCAVVANKLKMGLHGSSDIEALFKAYNEECR